MNIYSRETSQKRYKAPKQMPGNPRKSLEIHRSTSQAPNPKALPFFVASPIAGCAPASQPVFESEAPCVPACFRFLLQCLKPSVHQLGLPSKMLQRRPLYLHILPPKRIQPSFSLGAEKPKTNHIVPSIDRVFVFTSFNSH